MFCDEFCTCKASPSSAVWAKNEAPPTAAVSRIFRHKTLLHPYLDALLRHDVLDEVVEGPGPGAGPAVAAGAGDRPEHAHLLVQEHLVQGELRERRV